jgi:hypothetical protein
MAEGDHAALAVMTVVEVDGQQFSETRRNAPPRRGWLILQRPIARFVVATSYSGGRTCRQRPRVER